MRITHKKTIDRQATGAAQKRLDDAAKDGRGDESPRTGQESEVAEDEMLG